jgi:hypothetical protein
LTLLGEELFVSFAFVLGLFRLWQTDPRELADTSRVSDDYAWAIKYLDFALGLAYLKVLTDVASRDFVAIGIDVDVALEVDDSAVDTIDGRAP